jgi:hypothetical protein
MRRMMSGLGKAAKASAQEPKRIKNLEGKAEG